MTILSRFANKLEIKALIEAEQKRLLLVVPDAVQNIKDLVTEMKDIPKDDIERRGLSYKASKDVLKSVGLMPTPVQSQVFVNLYQSNNQFISPVIMQALGITGQGQDQEDNSIDVEFYSDT